MFAQVLAEHPRLPVVLAHAGMPDFTGALDLVRRYEHVRIDTTMVGTPYSEQMAPLPGDWAAQLVDVADRWCSAPTSRTSPTPTPSRCAAVAGWAAADGRLGTPFLRSVLHDAPARLLGVARDDPACPRALDWQTPGTGRRGGERFRLWTSIKGKRVEEGNDELVNHPLQTL